MKRTRFLVAVSAAALSACAHRSGALPPVKEAGSALPKSYTQYDPAYALPRQPIIGEVRRFDGATAPPGWMFLDGRTLRQAEYPVLYGMLARRSGVRAKQGTFVLPHSHAPKVIAISGVAPLNARVVDDVVRMRPHAHAIPAA